MALTLEWRRRVERWRDEIKEHFYRPLGNINLRFFATREQLTADEALKGDFKPALPGLQWGAKWEYGWFAGSFTLPDAAAGHRIVLRLEVGADSLISIKGRYAGAKDAQHSEVTICMKGVAGERYDVLAEAYAGHGPRVCHTGPTPPGRLTVPEPQPAQATIGHSTFGIWNEDAYQLWLDVDTLVRLRDNIDQESLRVAEIDKSLRDFTTIVDFELPEPKMTESIRACREQLRSVLACTNGSTAPTMFAFGHAHQDLAWLWPLAETDRKVARTFSNQLALMEEYPDYKFLQSQPYLYKVLERLYPQLYERVRAMVKAARVIPDGGMWVEADTNIPSGESLIRQFIHGKRFFQEEFGIDSQVLWIPDVFGYSAALPQIMRGCGIKYFATAKILWSYNDSDPFPYNTFTWEGIDGSEVLVHLCRNYNSQTDPTSVIERWRERLQKDGISTRLLPFGWGDGGGGPTRDHLEYLRRLRDLEGAPRTRISSPAEFFHDQESRGVPDARYVGELYLQCHRGTYTSQARTKRANRKVEVALREAELWGVAASLLAGLAFDTSRIGEAWKKVLLNQFHDIIPGSSIERVYQDAGASYKEAVDAASDMARQAIGALTRRSEALTVFNSLSWERTELVPLPQGCVGALDTDGRSLPAQDMGGRTFVEASVPPMGWTTLRFSDKAAAVESPDSRSRVRATEKVLENGLLRVEFNQEGEVTSIFDKQVGQELAAGPCNSFRMYKDVPTVFDAWDIDSMYPLNPVRLEEPASFELVASGPLVAKIRITRKLHQSTMTQDVSLRRGSRRVEFRTRIDWQESHKLLKVAFPVDIHANESVHEIQFGHVHRPNHMSRPFDADRFEVTNHKWTALMEEDRGFAILNDCKYGISVLGNCMSLTLLKAGLAPDMTADKGVQEFTYAFFAWNGSFADSRVVQEAYELNYPTSIVDGDGGATTLFELDAPNVIIETVKPAEDGTTDIIVRLYESKRTAMRCTLSVGLSVAVAFQTDMLENVEAQLPCQDDRIELRFHAFEVKTIRLRHANLSVG